MYCTQGEQEIGISDVTRGNGSTDEEFEIACFLFK